MKDEQKEQKILSMMAARRPDGFWEAQKKRILGAVEENPRNYRAWLFAPVAAAAVVMVFVLARGPSQVTPDEPGSVSTAFLDHLDLLDDMDVIESVPEEEL